MALEAIRGQQTTNELASAYGVHLNLIREWKQRLLSEFSQVFNSRTGEEQKLLEEERDRLFQQIGQLQYKLAWLKRKVGVERSAETFSRSVKPSTSTSPA